MDRRAPLLVLILLGLALAAAPAEADGPTYVAGPVEGAWTLAGSPYILVGNTTVEPGRTLHIEAGVEVRADRGTGLDVLGTLEVRGTADAPVRFTANATIPEPGFWRGIHKSGGGPTLTISHAAVDFAQLGFSLTDASIVMDGVSIGHSAEGGIAGVRSSIFLRRSLLSGNPVGISLAISDALVENTTFVGSLLEDVALDVASYVRLRVCTRETRVKVLDDASRADIEGIVAVRVADKFGVPQAGAPVVIQDNLTNRSQVLRATTDHEGRVTGVVVKERSVSRPGGKDFNPFRVTAGTAPFEGFADVVVEGFKELVLTIPADLTPPTPVASPFLAVDEDLVFILNATASTDNDPSFAATGAFVWRFPDLGVEITGITAGHALATPGLVQGVLTASDAAGNEAYLSFAVQVRDVTPPSIATFVVPSHGGTGDALLFEAQASDNDPLFIQSASYDWTFTLGTTELNRAGPSVVIQLAEAGAWDVRLAVRDPTGNEVTVQGRVTVVAPPTPNPWPALLGGGALFATAAALATERGKAGLFLFVLPLYTRLKDEDVLDQFTRGQIYGYIRVHPGDTYTDIKRNLGLTNGTLTYHLDVLARQGFVRSIVRGSRKMFFPQDVRPPEDGGGLAEIQRRMLGALDEAPGIAIADLAASLGISRQLALYHTRLLAGRGLVRLERRGLRLIGYPVPRPQ